MKLSGRKLYIHAMSLPHARLACAAMRGCGVEAEVTPPSDAETLTRGGPPADLERGVSGAREREAVTDKQPRGELKLYWNDYGEGWTGKKNTGHRMVFVHPVFARPRFKGYRALITPLDEPEYLLEEHPLPRTYIQAKRAVERFLRTERRKVSARDSRKAKKGKGKS